MSGHTHPSAVGRAQDKKSSPVKDQRSTTVPRNQPSSENKILTIYLSPCMLYIRHDGHRPTIETCSVSAVLSASKMRNATPCRHKGPIAPTLCALL